MTQHRKTTVPSQWVIADYHLVDRVSVYPTVKRGTCRRREQGLYTMVVMVTRVVAVRLDLLVLDK
jgi:hypothetical protein